MTGNSRFNDALLSLRRDFNYAAYLQVAGLLSGENLPRTRIHVMRNFTIEPLYPVLQGEAALMGRVLEFSTGSFDTVMQEAMSDGSEAYAADTSLIIMARWLDLLSSVLSGGQKGSDGDRGREVDRLLDETRLLLKEIRRRTTKPILLNNFPLPCFSIMPAAEARNRDGLQAMLLRLNLELGSLVLDFADVYLVDYLSTFAISGSHGGYSARLWNAAKMPLGKEVMIPLGWEYCRYFRALWGKTRKCLVVDCDDTLWGGIVGEEGIDGIRLAQDGVGAGYRSFQLLVRELRARGILLAICSRNNREDVIEVFDGHPEMVLKKSDFAIMEINWNDKATNLRKISAFLNIATDALVFADNSAFECNMVRQILPEVEVVELTGDPSSFAKRLAERGLFDTVVVSDEDLHRTEMIHSNIVREAIRSHSNSLDDYLRNLKLVVEIGPARAEELRRVAQLTQKTNQFNLTSIRYTEGEIIELSGKNDIKILILRVKDSVSDLGLVGVCLLRFNGDRCLIDTFLLSCRAFGRGLENVLLETAVSAAAARSCEKVEGRFSPTTKNRLASGFLSDAGFAFIKKDGTTEIWDLNPSVRAMTVPHWFHNIIRRAERTDYAND